MPLFPPLPTYVVGCRNGHKFFLSHQEVETHSPPLDFDLGHVICFGHWDLSKCDTAEAYKVHQHHVNEPGASPLYDGRLWPSLRCDLSWASSWPQTPEWTCLRPTELISPAWLKSPVYWFLCYPNGYCVKLLSCGVVCYAEKANRLCLNLYWVQDITFLFLKKWIYIIMFEMPMLE